MAEHVSCARYYASHFVCYLIFLTVLMKWILFLAPFIDEETDNMLMTTQLRVHDPNH